MKVLLYVFILAFIASAQCYPSVNPLSAVGDDGEILLRLKRGHHGHHRGNPDRWGGNYGGNYGGYPGYPVYAGAPSNQFANYNPVQSGSQASAYSSSFATGSANGGTTSTSANAASSALGGFPGYSGYFL